MDCPRCGNRGVLLRMDEAGTLRGAECSCMAARRTRRRMERSGLGDLLDRCTFEAFRTPEPWQREAKAAALDYAGHPDGWLLAWGATGAGKTHLCTAVCGKLLEAGVELRYVLWRDLSSKAKALAGRDAAAYTALVEPLKLVPALYIDDLFKSGRVPDGPGRERVPILPGAPDVNLAFEILSARACAGDRLTLLSTELSLAELLSVDEALGSRIYRAAAGHLLSFDKRPNWRLRKPESPVASSH